MTDYDGELGACPGRQGGESLPTFACRTLAHGRKTRAASRPTGMDDAS
jgi:hypothetical protein